MDESSVEIARDDGAQQETGAVAPPVQEDVSLSHDSYYRSQREVDEAFSKRFAAERQKWEHEAVESHETAVRREAEAERERRASAAQKSAALIGEIERQAAGYPDFDIRSQMEKNPEVAYLLAAGYSLPRVYELLYPGMADERRSGELADAVIERVRARNLRPAPISGGGGGEASAAAYLTERRIAEIDSAVKRGQRVVL